MALERLRYLRKRRKEKTKAFKKTSKTQRALDGLENPAHKNQELWQQYYEEFMHSSGFVLSMQPDQIYISESSSQSSDDENIMPLD